MVLATVWWWGEKEQLSVVLVQHPSSAGPVCLGLRGGAFSVTLLLFPWRAPLPCICSESCMGQFPAPPLEVGHLSPYWYVILDPELLPASSSRVEDVAFSFSFPLPAPVPRHVSRLTLVF